MKTRIDKKIDKINKRTEEIRKNVAENKQITDKHVERSDNNAIPKFMDELERLVGC